ncbi:predicted protein [Entamoeba histolytica]
MNAVLINQLFKEVIETLPNIQQSIDDTTKNYQYYIRSIKNEVFTIKPNETYSEAIKRGEGIFDRMDETERRRKLVIEKSQETINKIKTITDKMEKILKECNNDGEIQSKTRNEVIENIIHIEEMNMKDKTKELEEEINKIKTKFNKKKEEWEKQYSDYFLMKKRKEEERRQQQEERVRREPELRLQRKAMKETMEEMRQIEEWTNRKIGNIICESDVDNWNKDTSVFDQRIKNKEHIIFIIEDEDGNKFGGYVNEKIDKVGAFINGFIKDSKSFVFSLESKGRMKGIMKLESYEENCIFLLCSQRYDWLFKFERGNDVCVYKENDKTKSCCKQNSFEYNGISNALCGKELPKYFTPKHFIVIEMK